MLRDLASSAELEQRASAAMRRVCDQGWTISTAESCTGGLVSALLTDIEGCSHAFDRGFVAYTEDAKTDLLGVDPAVLAKKGAVSKDVALAMAEGGLRHSKAHITLAVTGFAGPTGIEGEEGLVHFALAMRNRPTRHEMHRFGTMGRDAIRHLSVLTLLEMLESVVSSDGTPA